MPYPIRRAPTLPGLLLDDLQVREAQQALLDWWNGMNNLQRLGSSPWPPFATDVAGLLGDVQMYAQHPEDRTWQNYGMTAAGVIPLIPPMASITARHNK